MLLTIDIKDSALDKIMYLLTNLKSDVKIVETEQRDIKDNFDFITTEELVNYKKISNNYKNGNKKDFVEYVL